MTIMTDNLASLLNERLQAIVNALDRYEPNLPPSQSDLVRALGPVKLSSQVSE